MQAHADTLSWLTGRAWSLNEWLLPRVRLWITWKWDAAAQPGAAAVGTTRITRGMLFIETKTDRTAGHEWLETGKNIKCTLCGCELKYYMKLEKPKVSMALWCTAGVRVVVSGSGLHPNLHCTHTMTLERGRKYLCQLCRGQYTSGGSLMGLVFCLRWQVEFETETALQAGFSPFMASRAISFGFNKQHTTSTLISTPTTVTLFLQSCTA